MIRLVGPGGAGKTTTGALPARRLGVAFVDLDERLAATYGDISEYIDVHGYAAYATQNVQTYLGLVGSECGPFVLALSSGFMTYANDVHPKYAPLRREIAASPTTLVLLPSLDYETCVTGTVRRQLGRPFRSLPDMINHDGSEQRFPFAVCAAITSERRTLTATSRPGRGSRARCSAPMPPSPRGLRISYGPTRNPGSRGKGRPHRAARRTRTVGLPASLQSAR